MQPSELVLLAVGFSWCAISINLCSKKKNQFSQSSVWTCWPLWMHLVVPWLRSCLLSLPASWVPSAPQSPQSPLYLRLWHTHRSGFKKSCQPFLIGFTIKMIVTDFDWFWLMTDFTASSVIVWLVCNSKSGSKWNKKKVLFPFPLSSLPVSLLFSPPLSVLGHLQICWLSSMSSISVGM